LSKGNVEAVAVSGKVATISVKDLTYGRKVTILKDTPLVSIDNQGAEMYQ